MTRGAVNGRHKTAGTIDRPRLRAVLDAFTANVILIIGPAGYGKTTLARQWVTKLDCDTAWYQCTQASTDIAALALGIARASSGIFPAASQLLESRLRAATPDATDAAALVELLTRDGPPTRDALLVVDDYHHLMRSGPAEQLFADLVSANAVRLVICSRRRPSWASARRLLYAEIEELARSELAMTAEEVAEVLGAREAVPTGLFDVAGGWPAVIGLASRSRDAQFNPMRRLPSELYEFFAEELYQALPRDLRADLHRLVILPSSAHDHVGCFFGPRATEVVAELTRLGFLTTNEQAETTNEPPFDLHPLLREFVEEKLSTSPRETVVREATQIVETLLELKRWDDGFVVIRRFAVWDLLPRLVEQGMWELLEGGRITTIDEWLADRRIARLKSPVLDLAQAELLLRRGAWGQAVRIASDAAEAFGRNHPLTSRALNCAARAAHFSDRTDLATDLHGEALESAQRPEDVRQSLWGKFICENSIDRVEDARQTLERYETLEVVDQDDLIRRMSGRLVFAARHGPLQPAVDAAPSSLDLLQGAVDPMTRTGFLQIFAFATALAARYADARKAALLEIQEAEAYRLDAIEAHALCALAMAELGLQQLKPAEAALDRAEARLRGVDDVHGRMNIAALRMRIALIRGDYESALREANRVWSRVPNAGIQGDLLATRALVELCAGDVKAASVLTAEAERATVHIETRVAVRCVVAGTLIREHDRRAAEASLEAFAVVEKTGAYDPFIVAYRTFPSLLTTLVKTDARKRLASVLLLAGDRQLARGHGLIAAEGAHALSKRELEVLSLLAQGLTNRDIARALWITEGTAKVHVRHIFDKLEVRTRAAAAVKAQEILPDRLRQPASAMSSRDVSR